MCLALCRQSRLEYPGQRLVAGSWSSQSLTPGEACGAALVVDACARLISDELAPGHGSRIRVPVGDTQVQILGIFT